MCLAISLVLMTTLVGWQSISRWHYRSTPPHLWSLCNGPKSWGSVSLPTFPFRVLTTFTPFRSTFCFQMPMAFHLTLGLLQLQGQRHRSEFQDLCQSWATLTQALSPKCLSRFQRLHRILRPIHRFRMTSLEGVATFAKFLMNLR